MKLEQQVCSLDLAKRLKELGVKQESLFYWSNCCSCKKDFTIECSLWHNDQTGEWDDGHKLEESEPLYSAFTVSELGEMLPEGTTTRKGWGIDTDYVMFNNEADKICSACTEADARAKMLIYLLENKLI